MPQDSLDAILVHVFQKPGGNGDEGTVPGRSGGEGVHLGRIVDPHLRHFRQTGPPSQPVGPSSTSQRSSEDRFGSSGERTRTPIIHLAMARERAREMSAPVNPTMALNTSSADKSMPCSVTSVSDSQDIGNQQDGDHDQCVDGEEKKIRLPIIQTSSKVGSFFEPGGVPVMPFLDELSPLFPDRLRNYYRH